MVLCGFDLPDHMVSLDIPNKRIPLVHLTPEVNANIIYIYTGQFSLQTRIRQSAPENGDPLRVTPSSAT